MEWIVEAETLSDFVDHGRYTISSKPLIRCKDCKRNPKYEWFGCPMSHLNEKQRPETAWCWKGERRTDGQTVSE